MKFSKMMLIAGLALILTGCSFTKIKKSQDMGPDTTVSGTTQETGVEGTTDFGELQVDEVLDIDTTEVTSPEPEVLTTEEKELTQKVKNMIDERKAKTNPDEGLTEEDIELMENILEEILN